MATRAQRKAKGKRKRFHAQQSREKVVIFPVYGSIVIGEGEGEPVLVSPPDWNLDEMVVVYPIPSRAKCSTCGFSQKVRKDGTFGRHDAPLNDPGAIECAGTGMRWDS